MRTGNRYWLAGIAAVAIVAAAAQTATAQGVFSSGSDGSDGPLVLDYYSAPEIIDMVYDTARQRMVGIDINEKTYEFIDNVWEEVVTSNKLPSAMNNTDSASYLRTKLVFDQARGVTVCYYSGVTYEFNGADWSISATSTNPPCDYFYATAYDSAQGLTVLYGGQHAGDTVGFNSEQETWVYDGDWEQIFTATSPPPRYVRQINGTSSEQPTVMAYDSSRQRMVLFGGYYDNYSDNVETWEFNGVNWTNVQPTAKPTNYGGNETRLAYDPDRQRVVMFYRGYHHEYDGTTWERLNPVSGSLYPHGLAYDTTRDVMIATGNHELSPHFYDPVATNWNVHWFYQDPVVIDMNDKPNGIWQYSRVYIGSNIDVSFTRNAANTPVTWLVAGDVFLGSSAKIDISAGSVPSSTDQEGGPGGYNGGDGGIRFEQSGSYAGQPGQGPGGGLPGTTENQIGGNAGYKIPGPDPVLYPSGGPYTFASGGPAYGNDLIQPLIGGSGGGGGASSATSDGITGGGGGGAILIAASGKITLTSADTIDAGGHLTGSGASQYKNDRGSGSGSGGAVRLIANIIDGSGTANVSPHGRLHTQEFDVDTSSIPSNQLPLVTFSLAGQSSIRITDVAGKVVPLVPTGNPATPDVFFSETGPVTVKMETQNIPTNTVITVRITSEGQIITANSSPVAADGTAEATAVVPAGKGTIQAYTEFTNP